jgi:hypothetical protein
MGVKGFFLSGFDFAFEERATDEHSGSHFPEKRRGAVTGNRFNVLRVHRQVKTAFGKFLGT